MKRYQGNKEKKGKKRQHNSGKKITLSENTCMNDGKQHRIKKTDGEAKKYLVVKMRKKKVKGEIRGGGEVTRKRRISWEDHRGQWE